MAVSSILPSLFETYRLLTPSPSMWLPTIMVAWGIVMICMGFVQNFVGLLVTRVFLGITEAGLFPGVSFFLTQWYRRYEINLRIAIFFSAATAAGAFGGLLARLINLMDGIAGYEGWVSDLDPVFLHSIWNVLTLSDGFSSSKVSSPSLSPSLRSGCFTTTPRLPSSSTPRSESTS